MITINDDNNGCRHRSGDYCTVYTHFFFFFFIHLLFALALHAGASPTTVRSRRRRRHTGADDRRQRRRFGFVTLFHGDSNVYGNISICVPPHDTHIHTQYARIRAIRSPCASTNDPLAHPYRRILCTRGQRFYHYYFFFFFQRFFLSCTLQHVVLGFIIILSASDPRPSYTHSAI